MTNAADGPTTDQTVPNDTCPKATASASSGVWRIITRVLVAIIVVMGAAFTAAAWIVSSPEGAGPDDDFHLTSIWCPEPVGQFCKIVGYDFDDKSLPIVEVPARIAAMRCFIFNQPISAGCSTQVSPDAVIGSDRVNNGGYPGAYYRIMHVFVSSSPSGSDTTNLLVRSANALIAALFFGVLAWLLPRSMKRLLAYVMVGFSVPLVIYFVTSVNPSAWVFIGVPVAWFALTGLFATRFDDTPAWRRRALAVVAVLAALMCAGARSDGATYCFVAVLAVGAAHLPDMRPSRWRTHRLVWAGMLVVSVIGIVGTFGGSQSSGLVGLNGGTAGDGRLLIYNVTQLPGLIAGFWTGMLGWLDTPMGSMTTVLSMAVGVGLMFQGMRRMSWMKGIAAGGVAFLLLVVPVFTLQMSGLEVGQGVQPRYLAPLMLLLAAVLLSYRKKEGTRALTLGQTWVMFVFLVLAQSWALHELIRRYVSGASGPELDLNKQVEWWRAGVPSPMITWVVGSIGFACLALVLFTVRHRASEVGAGEVSGNGHD
ncbi:MAG: DUF2142 domain-containing protein [Propionibacteriaceae bacterium]|nr:DUF2142 domain-containing protein [Propionibacteriaceae bacterium]